MTITDELTLELRSVPRHGWEELTPRREWILRGPKGAVVFAISRNTAEEHEIAMTVPQAYCLDDSGWSWTAWDLGRHTTEPARSYEEMEQENCGYLDGKPCYYDGSGLQAQYLLKHILRQKRNWNAAIECVLRDRYHMWIEAGKYQ